MGKNIMVLGMSTLSLDTKKDGSDISEIKVNRFCWKPGDEIGEEYFSQLEPTSRMILEREESLDQIIIFATPETKEAVKFMYQGEKTEMSAVDFYLKRVGITDRDKVAILEVSDENFTHAIYESVEIIRTFWKENEKNGAKLWIDTQGGFRNTNLVVNAIMSLLKSDNIIPSGIYSIKYSKGNQNPNPIQDQTDTYKIFDFVSGVNEFSRYGRAEQLEDYYKGIAKEKVPEIIKKMKSIAEDIQMCDMICFDKDLSKLREIIHTKKMGEDDLLNIFRKQIENDYGNLLKKSCTKLDIVEWLYKKKFYQQAITYIEAKLPAEWEKNNIINYKEDIATKSALKTIKKDFGKGKDSDINVIVTQIGRTCFKWKSIVEMNASVKMSNFKDAEVVKRLRNGREEPYQKGLLQTPIPLINKWETSIGEVNMLVDYKKQDDIMAMLLLYKLLKNERNNFNHMSEKNNTRATQETLGRTIHLFIEVGRKVYEE